MTTRDSGFSLLFCRVNINGKKPNHGTGLKTSHGLSDAGAKLVRAVLEQALAKPELWLLRAVPLHRLTSLHGRSFTPVTKCCLSRSKAL